MEIQNKMNYEEKYKESLEKAQIYRNHLIETGYDTNEIEYIFPELINEDERIRREILNVCKQFDKDTRICGENYDYDKWIAWIKKQDERNTFDTDTIKKKAHQIGWETSKHYDPNICKQEWCEMAAIDMASWLKKQCKQKPIEEYDVPNTPIKDTEVVTSRMKYIDDNLKPIAEFIIGYANWDLRKDEWNHPVATVPLFRVLDALVQKGKQYSEEHHVVDNNTKPKFKIGDWITNGDYTWKVIEVKPLDYILQSQDGNVVDDTISYVDGNFILWDVTKDAKDGDVLFTTCNNTNEMIFIYYGIEFDAYNCYFLYSNTKNEYKTFNAVCSVKANITPATKEQRSILFQKISEAGYTWNAEKKELTKEFK